jgi:type IV pilus assembly protein PilB
MAQKIPHTASRIGELLVSAGLVSSSQLDEALEYQLRHGCRLGSALVELGAVDEKVLTVFLAMQRGQRVIHLKGRQIDPDLLELVPADLARRLGAVPLSRTKDTLEVAVVDPNDTTVTEALERTTGLKVNVLIAPQTSIHATINRCYPSPSEEVSGTSVGLSRRGPDIDRVRMRLAEVRLILAAIERELGS